MDELNNRQYDATTATTNTPDTAQSNSLVNAYNNYNAGGVTAANDLRNRYTAAQQAAAAPAEDTAAEETPAEETAATPAAETPASQGYLTNENRVQAINDMYAAQQAARLAELENAYNLSMSEMQAAADKIPGQYQTQANANAVDFERQRRNWLEGANMNGINTGSAAQWQLSMMGQGNRTMNSIRTAQASAEAEAARQQANLTAQYQSNISQALANNDYQKAAALLDEYNNGYERDLKNAQVLAEFGDFSGYAGLYGEDVADGMSNVWAQQNPDLAYVSGRITKDQRDNIKANRPINEGLDENGVRIASSGGGGGGGDDMWGYGGSYYNWNGGGGSSSNSGAIAQAIANTGAFFGR